MAGSIFSALSLLVWIALAIPALVFLLRLYSRTQMGSLLWLIVAVLAWPLISRGTAMVMPLFITQFAASRALSISAVSGIYGGIYFVEAIIGGVLLLIAAILLERDITARMLPSPPPAPPQR